MVKNAGKSYIDKAIMEKEADETSSVALIFIESPVNSISHNYLRLGACFTVESNM
jgi:hypothetical protein